MQLKYNVNHEDWTCPMCHNKFITWGNNPAPFDYDGKVVCDTCNNNYVLPARQKYKEVKY